MGPTVFSKNRDRLIEGEITAKFLAAVLGQARVEKLLSGERFSVDGTLIEAWASMKSFRAKDDPKDDRGDDDASPAPGPSAGRNTERDFQCERPAWLIIKGW